MRIGTALAGLLLTFGCGAAVQAELPPGFHAGTRIADFGPVATVDMDRPIGAEERFRHAFDVSAAAEPGRLNRGFVSAARFLNALREAGAADENVRVAIVVHGPAGRDLLAAAPYAARIAGKGAAEARVTGNPNAPLVAALLEEGATIELCGQSAASLGMTKAELLPGVEMALSAMTAHARLQRDDYTLNPF